MTWRLETDYGTLELPRFDCLICFSNGRFLSCTACPVTREMARRAHDEWTRIWDEEQERKELERNTEGSRRKSKLLEYAEWWDKWRVKE